MSELPINQWMKGASPCDHEAERGFVGSLLAYPKYFDILSQPVYVECLYDPKLQLIYKTMLDMREDDEPIDVVTVANRLREKKQLDRLNNTDLPTLVHENPAGALAGHYAKIVVDYWKRRSIAYAATDAVRAAFNNADPEDIRATLEAKLDASSSLKAEEVIFDCFDVCRDVITEVRKRKAEGRHEVGVSTGFTDLDELTSGLVPSELFVIGARPGMGKTALALNIAVNACQTVPVLFVSIEMERKAVNERIIASVSGVNTVRVRRATVTDEEIDRMKHAVAGLGGGKLWIADIPHANMAEVTQIARQVKRKNPALAVVAIDYIQLIRHEERKMPREQQVADISKRLKALARSLNVCVIALSQLNRQAEGRKTKRPELSDLRESGAVEQDADVIALIHRPDAYAQADRPGEADLIVAKVRNGPTGEVALKYDKATTKFSNQDREWYEQPHAP